MGSLDDGFAVLEHCITASECDAVCSRLKSIRCVGTLCLLNTQWCQELAASLRDRMAAEFPNLRSLVAVQSTFFNKSADSIWFVALHQDRSIPVAPTPAANNSPGWSEKEGVTYIHAPNDVLEQMIAIRLHLDDCTPDNGPLRVIPNSHRNGSLSPDAIRNQRETGREVMLVVAKGGIIAMRPLLLHASSKSRTDANRRVLQLLYGPRQLPGGLAWGRAV